MSVFLLFITLVFADEVLFEATTEWGEVQVLEEEGLRTLMINEAVQSAIYTNEPNRLIYPYMEWMVGAIDGWGKEAEPRRLLLIGLGGGTLCRYVAANYGRVRIDAVEINRVVPRVARKYFQLPSKVRVHIGDGREFLEQSKKQWDVVVLDTASQDSMLSHMMTREFLRALGRRVDGNGLIIANSWADGPFADDELATWVNVYKSVAVLSVKDAGNRILVVGFEPDGAVVVTSTEGSVLTDGRFRGRRATEADSKHRSPVLESRPTESGGPGVNHEVALPASEDE
ncbi:MAG: fused MFS/spermidine synthase [Proteobacteria bacterium]|nr:fused MFS/spermidine synthase [Pseudomonadota bacterium]